MLTEAEMARVIHPDKRAAVIEHVMGRGLSAQISEGMRSLFIYKVPFYPLPRELWDFVQIIIPVVDDEEGERTERIQANEATISEFNGNYMPDLLEVNIANLTGDQLSYYASFLAAYGSWMTDLASDLKNQEAELRLAHKEILSLLPNYIYGSLEGKKVSAAEKKRYAAADPFVRQLETLALQKKAQHEEILSRVNWIEHRMKQSSRDVERRRQLFQFSGFGGDSDQAGMGSTPKHVPKASTRQRLGARGRR